MSDRKVVRAQVDVECDQEWSRANRNRSGARMKSRFAHVRSAVRISFDLFAQPFEAFTADVLKSRPIRSQRRALIKVDRNRKLAPNATTSFMRQSDAVVDCHSA